jgi:hypothetical protein
MYLLYREWELGLERQKNLLAEAEQYRRAQEVMAQQGQSWTDLRFARLYIGRLLLSVGQHLITRSGLPEESSEVRLITS